MKIRNLLSLGLTVAGMGMGCSVATSQQPASGIASTQLQTGLAVTLASAAQQNEAPTQPKKMLNDQDLAYDLAENMIQSNLKCPQGTHARPRINEKKGEEVKYKIACLDNEFRRVNDLVNACKGEVFMVLKDWPSGAENHPKEYQAWYCGAK